MDFHLTFKERLSGRASRQLDMTKKQPGRPEMVDKTGGLVADSATLEGLYYGTDVRTQFAAPLAFTPIAVPVSLMGIPTPVPAEDDQATKDAVKQIIAMFSDDMPVIHRDAQLFGTSWRWPRLDARNMQLVWENIPDATISDIELDVVSGDILAIHTHEMIKISYGENKVATVERKRKITRERIDVKWVQKGAGLNLQDSSMVNTFGFLPVPLGHDCSGSAWRGHSVYTRVIRLMKATHEIELKRDQILADFSPKLIQEVENVETWLANNGMDTLCDIDPFSDSFFLNIKDKEATKFEHLPATATQQHTEALVDNQKRLVIGSGVPELFWPLLATGNSASTDTQKNLGVAYVNSLRTEASKTYEALFNMSLTILGYINLRQYQPVTVKWNEFDMVAPEIRAQLFASVATGIGQIVQFASAGKEDILYFWKSFFPTFPQEDLEQFAAGMMDMAQHKAVTVTDPASLLDLGAGDASAGDEPA